CGFVIAVAFSHIASPLVLMPVLMCGSIVPFSHIPSINDRPWVLYVWCVIVSVAPTVLEATGLLTSTLTIGTTEHFELRSAIFAHSRITGMYALVLANAVLLIAVSRFAIAIARDRRDVQRKLTNQAWHLGKLLP
ncbi:MAG TPA: hypothetical protein VLB44_18950, partial [Kofleriaceae bacterium]|nr:hypothetical protein [Kofleriaceae bacterium]